MILPKSATKLYEESWDTFPKSKTILTSKFLGERFEFIIQTVNVENDCGEIENVHNLSDDILKIRKVHFIDIGNDPIENSKDYVESEDPALFESKLHHFGPLKGEWQKEQKQMMCTYKLVTVKCAIFGVQTKGENYVMNMEQNIFTRYHKQLYCWLDEWYGYTFDEILQREESLYDDMEAELSLDEEEGETSEKDKKKKKKKKSKKKGKESETESNEESNSASEKKEKKK